MALHAGRRGGEIDEGLFGNQVQAGEIAVRCQPGSGLRHNRGDGKDHQQHNQQVDKKQLVLEGPVLKTLHRLSLSVFSVPVSCRKRPPNPGCGERFQSGDLSP